MRKTALLLCVFLLSGLLLFPAWADNPTEDAKEPMEENLVMHWDLATENTYTDTMLRIRDIAPSGEYADFGSAQGDSTVSDGIGTVTAAEKSVFVCYHNSDRAVDVMNFDGLIGNPEIPD